MTDDDLDEDIADLLYNKDTGLYRGQVDAIMFQCDHIARISQSRRENFLSLFEPLRPHIAFSRHPANYNKEELHDGLFGRTFISALRGKVAAIQEGLQSFTSAHLATKKMAPAMGFTPDVKKPRYDSISTACSAIKHLNLPNSFRIFPFFDITGVNFVGGRIKEFFPNWQLFTNNPIVLGLVAGHLINFIKPPQTNYSLSFEGFSEKHSTVLENLLDQKIIIPGTIGHPVCVTKQPHLCRIRT